MSQLDVIATGNRKKKFNPKVLNFIFSSSEKYKAKVEGNSNQERTKKNEILSHCAHKVANQAYHLIRMTNTCQSIILVKAE